METTVEFREFGKIARLSREVIITEKIDGTNASVYIPEDRSCVLAGSRTRWITPDDDNYGFARWVAEHAAELATLGPGHHFGEWWGQGVQRGYGLREKRWSLFNVQRWCPHGLTPQVLPSPDPRVVRLQDTLPPCCTLVPVLWRGVFDTAAVEECLWQLRVGGSVAAPGFKPAEGVVVWHTAANVGFKKTILKDEQPKSKQ